MTDSALLLIAYVSGIYFFYLMYAFGQEEITKTNFGDDEHPKRFVFPLFLLCIQCSIGCLIAFISEKLLFNKSNHPDNTKQTQFMAIAFCYVTAMFASNSALIYISYPTQVLAKACKPIPVMIIGFLFVGKKYSLKQWFCVLLIVMGISMFLFKEGKTSKEVNGFEYWIGMGYLALSLICDGFTSPLQERLFSQKGSKPSPVRMMVLNNFYAAIFCLCGAFLFSNQGRDALLFCQEFPHLWFLFVKVSILAALGQLCIFMLIEGYGALVCTIATTTRKFFTILVSVIAFGHELSTRQWIGVAFVFTGLGLQVLQKVKKEKQK